LRNLWERFIELAAQRPDRLLINPEGICKVSEVASHYTIADFFLMPSTYEPCGLMQMECQRYGTVPIVRQTGGLADTVSEKRVADLASPNGFVFQGLNADALLAAVQRAVEAYRNASTRAHLIQNALLQQNGWETRVSQYEQLFGMS
jgi:starch synthase